MFIPIEQAAWPAVGEVRDLRVSLNAPVLMGPEPEPRPTQAALGWLPAESGAVVRLWLRAEAGAASSAGRSGSAAADPSIRSFELPERPLGPAARAAALERAERFLGGLGFLFPEARADSPHDHARTSDPDPARAGAAEPTADVTTAIRADVRLTQFRRRGPAAAP